eukprot:5219568-Lingulodinium_polyedra.AAC.1
MKQPRAALGVMLAADAYLRPGELLDLLAQDAFGASGAPRVVAVGALEPGPARGDAHLQRLRG